MEPKPVSLSQKMKELDEFLDVTAASELAFRGDGVKKETSDLVLKCLQEKDKVSNTSYDMVSIYTNLVKLYHIHLCIVNWTIMVQQPYMLLPICIPLLYTVQGADPPPHEDGHPQEQGKRHH